MKENLRNEEFEKRTVINKRRMEIEQLRNGIAKINGDIELLKREGKGYKEAIKQLHESKVCVSCNQTIEKDEHKEHIRKTILEKEKLMYALADVIKEKEFEKPVIEQKIVSIQGDIADIEKMIQTDTLNASKALENIGSLTNYKRDVDKRESLKAGLPQFDLQIENLDMKINSFQDKRKNYNDQKAKIEENNKLKSEVSSLNNQIQGAKGDIDNYKRFVIETQNHIKSYKQDIKQHEQAIKDYLIFERQELVRKLYAETIHRDGLPTQILTDTLLPKINNVLSKLLESADFDVYLDSDDLRLKFFYNDHPNAIIDCISASGMERTFAVYALKIALNQINSKSKSTLLTVDEVMGKLKNDYVDKFVELLHMSKKYYKKILIIEPTHEVHADYLLSIEKDKNHVSRLVLQ
jgi:hypothetical protein